MVNSQARIKKRRIVAVGAGPSGLAVLRVFADELKEEIASERCEIICFEKREDLGGVW
jgi:cation diffusion facilitator CzcD-associated flavoprotein CzcO